MSQLLVRPEEETFPHRKRWTRQECTDLQELGKLQGRYELIDGEVIEKMGQNPSHSVTLILIAHWLITLFGKLHVREQEPILLPDADGEYNEPEPDIAVTHQPVTAYLRTHPVPDDILLIVEVSDTTLRFDLTTKARLYARCGVEEYWVADVAARQLHVHHGPTADGYTEVHTLRTEDIVTMSARPDASVTVSSLFPPSDES